MHRAAAPLSSDKSLPRPPLHPIGLLSTSVPHASCSFRIQQLGLRHLSLNVFNRQPTPSPVALVRMTRLEADANANPTDISKQIALWAELIQYSAGQKRVLSRYERILEFDKHSPLIRSPELFQLYVKALLATNQAGAIDAAVRTRDAALASPPPKPEPEPKPLTPSQLIARDVVSAAAARPKENWVNSLKNRLSGAAAGGALSGGAGEDAGASGARANPVHVILEERKYLNLDASFIYAYR